MNTATLVQKLWDYCNVLRDDGMSYRRPEDSAGGIIAAMASVLDSHLAEIPDLCRRFGVARLELFGSAAGEAFDPLRSDLDFLVEFDADSSRLFDRYFGLKESLEALYGRRVDLVTAGSLRNRYFIEAVNKSRRLVYASEDAQAA
jgi:hypothetical protein